MGGADGAGAQYYFAGFYYKGLAPRFHLHPGGPRRGPGVKQDAMHIAVGADGQIQAVAGDIQVGQRGAEADAVGVVQRHRAHAGGVGMVEIGDGVKAGIAAGAVKGGLFRAPFRGGETAANDGAVGIMKVAAAEFGIGFHPAEIVEQVLIAP